MTVPVRWPVVDPAALMRDLVLLQANPEDRKEAFWGARLASVNTSSPEVVVREKASVGGPGLGTVRLTQTAAGLIFIVFASAPERLPE